MGQAVSPGRALPDPWALLHAARLELLCEPDEADRPACEALLALVGLHRLMSTAAPVLAERAAHRRSWADALRALCELEADLAARQEALRDEDGCE